MDDLMLARQPIYTPNNKLFAFELLYRNSDEDNANVINDFAATTELLANLCTNHLNEDPYVNRLIFINVDLTFLTSDCFFLIPPQDVVFEILETVEITEECINCIRELRKKGFQFALDDFELEGNHAELFPYVSYVKIDVQALSLDDFEQYLSHLGEYSFTLLAEKVEDKECFERCVKMGFELFQGYYLQRPTLIIGNKLSSSKQVALRIITELSRENITTREIADLIATDPRLTFKLLKIINCPLYPVKREIVNIHEAVVMLGVDTVKQWAQILALVSESEKPIELFRTLLVRAKACELYAISINLANAKDYFTVGLFSGIDAVLDLELKFILDEIKLAPHIKKELLSDASYENGVLVLVKEYENLNISFVQSLSQNTFEELCNVYWKSVKWADELMTMLV